MAFSNMLRGMAQFYSPELQKDLTAIKWDVIVIGSGLGGLTSASLLAKAGKKVLVLERHTVPGGFTHTFSRKGYVWDVGVHYVGQVGHPKAILRKIFDYVTDGKLKWDSMGPLYDRAVIAGETFDFVSGVNNQIQKWVEYFPEEKVAIKKYFKLIKSAGASSPWFFGEKTMPFWLSRTLGRLLRFRFEHFSKKTTYEVLSSLTQNKKLIAVLSAQCGDYGLPPELSSFGIHAVVVEHYLNGGSYPRGGANRIHETITASLEKNEGKLVLKAEVAEILVEAGKVCGVQLKNGEKILASTVISNAGARNTFKFLLSKDVTLPFDVDSDLGRVKSSIAHVCLYVGLNASDDALKLPKHNLWIYDQVDFDNAAYLESIRNPESAPSLTYISFPSAKDSAWALRHPGKAAIQIISACSYDRVKEWEKLPYQKRGADYLEFKKKMSERLLSKLYQALPDLRGKVEYSELSSPLSTRHFMNYERGEIYGLEHTPARFGLKWLRPQTPVKGLYLSGQDIVTVGVGGALFSGVLAATKVLNKSVILRILTGRSLKKKARRQLPPGLDECSAIRD